MKTSELDHGLRVRAEDPSGLDSESGVVLQINHDEGRALIGWDQGIWTWVEASALTEEVAQ